MKERIRSGVICTAWDLNIVKSHSEMNVRIHVRITGVGSQMVFNACDLNGGTSIV